MHAMAHMYLQLGHRFNTIVACCASLACSSMMFTDQSASCAGLSACPLLHGVWIAISNSLSCFLTLAVPTALGSAIETFLYIGPWRIVASGSMLAAFDRKAYAGAPMRFTRRTACLSRNGLIMLLCQKAGVSIECRASFTWQSL